MKIHIIGGGTISYVRNHLALCAPAYGTVARDLTYQFERAAKNQIRALVRAANPEIPVGVLSGVVDHEYDTCGMGPDVLYPHLHLTRMADPTSKMATNADVAALMDELLADPETKVIVMTAALCDFDGDVVEVEKMAGTYFVDDFTEDRRVMAALTEPSVTRGSHAERLKTRSGKQYMVQLTPAEKVIGRIRKGPNGRKDVFLVACKTTTGATEQEQYRAALNLLKENSANLVLANDTVTRRNMVVVPEEARYHVTTDRAEAVRGLAEMILLRANLTFTRSTVIGTEADLVPWSDERVPMNLRVVVNHAIARGAYKPFRGKTAGHFAVNLGDGKFLTSIRKRDFNDLNRVGLVYVESDGDDHVVAHGAKPSVGGQSQRIIFREHPGYDCIFHAHVPLKDGVTLPPIVEQRPRECGSHECGRATSAGLAEVAPGIKVVMLENHGPNVVFRRDVPAEAVIQYIEDTFDLSQKTGGPVS